MKNYLDFAIKTADQAGRVLLRGFDRVDIASRDSSISTKYDRLSDQIIKRAITKRFPDHSILTEETGLVDKNSDYLWIIDPLDGTGNFINHNPFFSISIALWYKDEPIMGLIEAPFLKERYFAVKGEGALAMNTKTRKKRQLKVSRIHKLEDSFILFCGGHQADNARVGEFVRYYYPLARSMRKIGSASLECAWVASGRAEAFITPRVRLWDVAAGALLVQESGGRALDFDLRPISWLNGFRNNYTLDLVVANSKLFLGNKIRY